MSDNALSEQAKVEMMKLAVKLTQQYLSSYSRSGIPDRSTLRVLGVEGIQDDANVKTIIDHLYGYLCGQIKP